MRVGPYSFFTEELCSKSAGVGNIFGAHSLGLMPVILSPYSLAFTWLFKRVVDHHSPPTLFAFALTEPSGGSDVQQDEVRMSNAKIQTYARRAQDGYILSGRKVFISNGSVADFVSVFAKVKDFEHDFQSFQGGRLDFRGFRGYGGGGFIWLLVRGKDVKVSRVENKMGQKTCHAAEIVFDDVFIPDDMVLCHPDDGAFINRVILATSRAPVGAIATGIARSAIKKVLSMVDRDDELALMRISEALAKLQMARLMWFSSCVLIDFHGTMKITRFRTLKLLLSFFSYLQAFNDKITKWLGRKIGEKFRNKLMKILGENLREIETLSSMAKFSATDLAMQVCLDCAQVVGEEAVDAKNELERYIRDVKLTQIYETTNEVNKLILWRNLVRTRL